jgi:hypothetical protein
MTLIERASTVFEKLRQIFGVPAGVDTAASRAAAQHHRAAETPMYLPESAVPPGGIDGVAADGSTWQPWRVSAIDGETWYARTSGDDAPATPTIHGIAPGDELPDNDAGDVDPWQAATNPADAVRNYHLRQAERKLRARHEAFPLIDGDSGDSDADDVAEGDDDAE